MKESKKENRVLARSQAQELTSKELEKVSGAGTATAEVTGGSGGIDGKADITIRF